MTIPLIDLKAQYGSIREEVGRAAQEVLESGTFILGPNVEAFESEIADYVGVRHAVGVASGTDALLLSLRAMGIGPGDEVIVPAYTFFATVGVVIMLGATPILVDVDPETYCLDVEQLEARIGPRTKAIIPVHLFGHPAEMDTILRLSQQHDLKVIEDNAQALGSEYKGRRTGSLGHAGCLSFFPSKNLGAYGDGGMVVTDDASLAEHLRMLRTHGWKSKYYSEMVGYNSRLDELQGAMLRVKLRHLDQWNEMRRQQAAAYTERMADWNIGLPREMESAHHIYHLYVIWVNNRDRVAQELEQAGISTAVYYPYALHQVPAMEHVGYRTGDYPVAEAAADHCLAIPIFPEMTMEQLDSVVNRLGQITEVKSVLRL